MLTLTRIDKRFGDRRALAGVSLAVAAGEAVLLVGRNGAGKTTLLRIATGFLDPDRGAVEVDGIAMSRARGRAQAKLGYLPEHAPAPPELSVRDHLRLRARLKRLGRHAEAAVGRAMELAGVASEASRRIGVLSKGFRQRVGLADALLGEPPLLILDEPTSGMDPIQVRELREHLISAAKQRAVLVSSHAVSDLEPLAMRVAVLREGELVADDTAVALREATGTSSLEDAVVKLLAIEPGPPELPRERTSAERRRDPARTAGARRLHRAQRVLGVAPRAQGHAARADRLRHRRAVPRRPGHRVRRARQHADRSARAGDARGARREPAVGVAAHVGARARRADAARHAHDRRRATHRRLGAALDRAGQRARRGDRQVARRDDALRAAVAAHARVPRARRGVSQRRRRLGHREHRDRLRRCDRARRCAARVGRRCERRDVDDARRRRLRVRATHRAVPRRRARSAVAGSRDRPPRSRDRARSGVAARTARRARARRRVARDGGRVRRARRRRTVARGDARLRRAAHASRASHADRCHPGTRRDRGRRDDLARAPPAPVGRRRQELPRSRDACGHRRIAGAGADFDRRADRRGARAGLRRGRPRRRPHGGGRSDHGDPDRSRVDPRRDHRGGARGRRRQGQPRIERQRDRRGRDAAADHRPRGDRDRRGVRGSAAGRRAARDRAGARRCDRRAVDRGADERVRVDGPWRAIDVRARRQRHRLDARREPPARRGHARRSGADRSRARRALRRPGDRRADDAAVVRGGARRPGLPASRARRVRRGGDAAVPGAQLAATGLEGVLAGDGIGLPLAIAVDPTLAVRELQGSLLVIDGYTAHPIDAGFAGVRPTIWFQPRAVVATGGATPLVRASDASWGERDLLHPPHKDGDDLAGPVPLAAIGAKHKIVAIGSAESMTRPILGGGASAGDLWVAQAVRFVAGRPMRRVAVAARTPDQVRLVMTPSERFSVIAISVAVIPLVWGAIGAVILLVRWRRRR